MKLHMTHMSRAKKAAFIAIAVLLLCSTLMSMFPMAGAADKICKTPGETYDVYKKDLEDHANGNPFPLLGFDILCLAFGCHPEMNFSKIVGDVYKFSNFEMKFPTKTGHEKTDEIINNFIKEFIGDHTTLTSAAANMYGVFKVAGIALILLYFLIEIMDEVQADNFNVEHLIKKLITLAIAILVMQQGDKIFTLISELGDAFIDDSVTSVIAGNERLYDAYEHIHICAGFGGDGGLFSTIKMVFGVIGVILQHVVAYLLMMVALLFAYLTAYSRFIEFLVRFAFAPIGIAPLVSGGSKGAGMRYIKKFASLCLQGAIISLAFGTVTIIQQQSSLVNGMIGQFIVPLTLIGFIFRTKQIADDVVGV